MNSNCGEAVMTPNQTLFARILIARITGCKNMIISANVKIKLGILMKPVDRTNNGQVLHVRKH